MRKFLNFLILLLAVCLLLVFFFQSTVPLFLKMFLTSRLSETLGANVKIDDIVLNFFVGTVHFEGFAVRGLSGRGVIINGRAEHIDADISLVELFSNRLVVKTLRLSRLRIVCTFEEKAQGTTEQSSAIVRALLEPIVYFDRITRRERFPLFKEVAARREVQTEAVNVTNVSNPVSFPIVVQKLRIEDMNIDFVDHFPDERVIETSLKDIEVRVNNLYYPDHFSEDSDVSFVVSAIVDASKLGHLDIRGTCQPFSTKLDFSLSLNLADIYIAHFQPYLFPGRNYEIRDGEFSLHSKVVCRSNFLRSKNEVTLSDVVLVPIGKQTNTRDEALRLLHMSGGVFSNLLNRVTERGFTVEFDVDANINDIHFRDGTIVKDTFLAALERQLVVLIKETPGGLRGLLGSLLAFPSWGETDVEKEGFDRATV